MGFLINKLGVGTKSLLAMAATGVPALCVAGWLGYSLIVTVQKVESEFDQAFSTARLIGETRVLIEKKNGLVARLPAELDQAKVTEFVAEIDKSYQQINERMVKLGGNHMIVTNDLAAQLNASRQKSAEVTVEIVKATKSFAQSTALELVNGPFEQATSLTDTLLDAIQSKVDSLADQAQRSLRDSANHAGKLVPIGLLAVALAILVGFFAVTRTIVMPLRGMARAMKALTEGKYDTVIPAPKGKDEIAEMADAVLIFKTSMVDAEQLRSDQAYAAIRKIEERKAEMGEMASRFESAIGDIVETVLMASMQLEGTAKRLTSTADSTQTLANTATAASEQASENVRMVSSAAEELSSSVQEISRRATESRMIADEAVQQSRSTDERIMDLSEAATRIGDVIKLINDIASQTNLLALNATIEAARAGEAGRGFAVVAQEVKALAAQTANATGDIGAQIANMQAATRESVASIKEIGQTISRIAEIAAAIASAVEEQGGATRDIAHNVSEAARGTHVVASNIGDVNRGASETGKASGEVLASAESLSSEAQALRREVDSFLSSVRAA